MEGTTLYMIAMTLLGIASSARVKHDGLIAPLQLINPTPFKITTTLASLVGVGMLIWGFIVFGWKLALLAFGASVVFGSVAVGLVGPLFILLAYISAAAGFLMSSMVVLQLGG